MNIKFTNLYYKMEPEIYLKCYNLLKIKFKIFLMIKINIIILF